MKRLRLIACDLDGTLLLNGAQRLQPDTCELIHRLGEQGILFCAASGRQSVSLERLFAPVSGEIGYITENGCLGFYQGRKLYKHCMDYDLGQEILRSILEADGVEVLLSGERISYLQTEDMEYVRHMREDVQNEVLLVPDILHTPEDYMKIAVYQRGGVQNRERWIDRFGSRCTVVTSGNTWLDMMPAGINKGIGLQQFLEATGIAPDECMAIGDNDNDLEMLRLVRWPVCVESARDSVKAVSRYRTDTVENLFRKILQGDFPH